MGVIVKYFSPVPAHKPYNPQIEKFLLAMAGCAIIGILAALFLTGCSYENKVSKTYKRAAQYSPITPQDSLNAIKVGKKVIKDVKPRIIPGKPIIKKVPYDKLIKVLDTNLVNHIADSLTDNLIAQTENYNSNIDEVIKGCNAQLRKATQAGYKQCLDSVLRIKLNDDTIPPDDGFSLDFLDCQGNLRKAQTEITDKDAQIKIYKKEAKDRFWIILILGAGFLTSLFFHAKKSITKLNIPK